MHKNVIALLSSSDFFYSLAFFRSVSQTAAKCFHQQELHDWGYYFSTKTVTTNKNL